MTGRREAIVDAAIDLLHESGYSELTQPKVAARAGMTQSHLTYYYPTRSDLLRVVAETIVARQLERFDAAGRLASEDELVDRIALITSSAPRSRALISLILAVDGEPAVRDAMRLLIDGLRARAAGMLALLSGEDLEDAPAHAVDARLLHAAWSGLAMVSLGEGEHADAEANRESVRRLVRLLLPVPARVGDA